MSRKARRKEVLASEPPWTPFEKTGQMVHSLTYDLPDGEVWANSRYVVVLRRCGETDLGALVWLSIRRQDNQACRDWRDLQRLKNELLGEEVEAVELYPAESRLVDNANQQHLWAIVGFRFPFGFSERLVSEGTPGIHQRPFPRETRPADLTAIRLEAMSDHKKPQDPPAPCDRTD